MEQFKLNCNVKNGQSHQSLKPFDSQLNIQILIVFFNYIRSNNLSHNIQVFQSLQSRNGDLEGRCY